MFKTFFKKKQNKKQNINITSGYENNNFLL